MADIQICLPENRASEIQDALFFLRGQYVAQAVINQEDESAPDYDVLEWFSEQLDAAILCGSGNMSCEDVLDCIDGQAGRELIGTIVTTNPSPSSVATLYPRIRGIGTTEIAPMDECNEDQLFNMITALVDAVHGDVVDLFEMIEVASNILEGVNILASAFGARELTLSIPQLLLSALGYVQSNFIENYNAQWSDEKRDELRCAIFCYVKDDCTFSILDYLVGAGVVPSTIAQIFDSATLDLEEVVNFLADIIDGNYDTVDVVGIMHGLVLFLAASFDVGFRLPGFVRYGQFARYFQQVKAASDESDNDWTVLCEDCATPDRTVTFDDNGWAYTLIAGNVVENVGNPNNAASITGFADIRLSVSGWEPTSSVQVDVKSTHNNVAVFVLSPDLSTIYGQSAFSGNGSYQTITIALNGTYTALVYSIQEGGFDPALLADNFRATP